jgi:N-acetylneuraminic acid mutarotase
MKERFLPFALAAALLALTSITRATRAEPVASTLAPMPEKVTSFGAATHDGWLYVFGGHKGERHEYSTEMVSGSFHRLQLSEGRVWERLPDAAAGQGQPLVAHGTYVYRIGGMAARNHEGEKQDLISTDLVQRFDTRRKEWETMAPLPAPRSSHDAAVLGDKLYVMGGWELSGTTKKAVWPPTALVLDLNDLKAGWKEFPQPFQRRALALAAQGSRVYCIGGMDSDNKTTLAVEVYDTATKEWTKGPDLPEGKSKGFGCSAIAQNGRIYANALKGDLLRLSADAKSWEVVGRLEHPRLAHRIVTAGTTQIIALGGEDGDHKRPELELLTPKAATSVASQNN